jgi:hypothetical protein
MRRLCRTVVLLQLLLPALARGAEPTLLVELNAAENVEARCRMTFVIENMKDAVIDSLRLDLVVFNREGILHRRNVVEFGPMRGSKTNVRNYTVDGNCDQIGSILVNDITACTPGDAGACLDGLALSTRVASVRFYK